MTREDVPSIRFFTEGPTGAPVHVLLAHGAGAPATSPFMTAISQLLAARGLQVSRFEFSYMALRRADGRRRPPPRADLLTAEFESAVHRVAADIAGNQRLVIGGKSLGGRVATMISDPLHASGVVAGTICLGYPFHPPAKSQSLRTSHLEALACPLLICQGTRDPFGSREEVSGYRLSPAIRLHWVAQSGHDLVSGSPAASDKLAGVADAVAAFCDDVLRR